MPISGDISSIVTSKNIFLYQGNSSRMNFNQFDFAPYKIVIEKGGRETQGIPDST